MLVARLRVFHKELLEALDKQGASERKEYGTFQNPSLVSLDLGLRDCHIEEIVGCSLLTELTCTEKGNSYCIGQDLVH